MSLLQNENLAYYHPCDDLFDGDGVEWGYLSTWGPASFTAGQVDSSLVDVDGIVTFIANSGLDGGLDGVDKFVTAFWSYDLVDAVGHEVSVGFVNETASFFQIVRVSQGDVILFSGVTPIVTWTGILSPASGWHFLVLDFEKDGSSWILKHSMDGASFTQEPDEAGASMGGLANYSLIGVGAASSPSPIMRVDEVAFWRNNTTFTPQEIQNLYDLGNIYELNMAQYSVTYPTIASGTLFMHAHQLFASSWHPETWKDRP